MIVLGILLLVLAVFIAVGALSMTSNWSGNSNLEIFGYNFDTSSAGLLLMGAILGGLALAGLYFLLSKFLGTMSRKRTEKRFEAERSTLLEQHHQELARHDEQFESERAQLTQRHQQELEGERQRAEADRAALVEAKDRELAQQREQAEADRAALVAEHDRERQAVREAVEKAQLAMAGTAGTSATDNQAGDRGSIDDRGTDRGAIDDKEDWRAAEPAATSDEQTGAGTAFAQTGTGQTGSTRWASGDSDTSWDTTRGSDRDRDQAIDQPIDQDSQYDRPQTLSASTDSTTTDQTADSFSPGSEKSTTVSSTPLGNRDQTDPDWNDDRSRSVDAREEWPTRDESARTSETAASQPVASQPVASEPTDYQSTRSYNGGDGTAADAWQNDRTNERDTDFDTGVRHSAGNGHGAHHRTGVLEKMKEKVAQVKEEVEKRRHH